MKELYFSPDNIDNVSAGILNEIKKYSAIRPYEINLNRTALLVLDMQRYFLDEASHAYIPSAKAIIEKINNLIALFNEKNMPVVYTKHINSTENLNMMSYWWNDVITSENQLSGISPDINVYNNDILIKSQYDAFYNTGLQDKLKESLTETVIITGVMTHLCCENTARSAFVRGYRVLFPVDTTATYNYSFHLASVLNLSHGYANVMLSDSLLESNHGE